MKKIFLIMSLLCVNKAHANDELAKAIRESDVGLVKELAVSASQATLINYCNLADKIIALRKDLLVNGEMLYALNRGPIVKYAQIPKKYWYGLSRVSNSGLILSDPITYV